MRGDPRHPEPYAHKLAGALTCARVAPARHDMKIPATTKVAGIFLRPLVPDVFSIPFPAQSVKENSSDEGGMQTWSSQHCHLTVQTTVPDPDPESGSESVASPS